MVAQEEASLDDLLPVLVGSVYLLTNSHKQHSLCET